MMFAWFKKKPSPTDSGKNGQYDFLNLYKITKLDKVIYLDFVFRHFNVFHLHYGWGTAAPILC